MTVAFLTLGCKLNQAETEALAEAYHRAGFKISRPTNEADIVIVNSCTVTGRSDAKSRQAVRRASAVSPHALVIMTGCFAEVDHAALSLELKKDAVAVVRQEAKPLLMGFAAVAAESFGGMTRTQKYEYFSNFLSGAHAARIDQFPFSAAGSFFRTRVFLKIQDGCDRRCAYCRVPLARGRSISLDFEQVMERIRYAVSGGTVEVVLTGVNICSYKCGENDLTSILASAVKTTRGVRFRVSSLEPEALTPALLEVLSSPSVCPHFHVSAQSGSAGVLGRMNRPYKPERLRDAVLALRQKRPDAFIAADVIVGFPGETNAEFEETRLFLQSLPIDALHVFPFSPRPGTDAFWLPGRVPSAVMKERVRILVDFGGTAIERFVNGLKGKTLEVLLEKRTASGEWIGSSEYSIKCVVEDPAPGAVHKGKLVRVRVSDPGRLCRAEFLEPVRGFSE